MQLVSAYGSSAAAKIDYRDGKVYLSIAPAVQESTGATRRYDWEKKKNFKLERSELVALRYVMETAFKKGVSEAQKACESLLGNGMRNCLFVHRTDHGQAFGGIELFESQGAYAPFRFRITFKPKNGNEETLRAGVTQVNAMAIIKDIELFNSEYIKIRLATEMSKEKAETQQYGADPTCPDGAPAP